MRAPLNRSVPFREPKDETWREGGADNENGRPELRRFRREIQSREGMDLAWIDADERRQPEGWWRDFDPLPGKQMNLAQDRQAECRASS